MLNNDELATIMKIQDSTKTSIILKNQNPKETHIKEKSSCC